MEEKQWFLYVVDHHEGPYSIEEIQKILKKGEARTTSYVWREGLEDWLMLSDLPEFGGTPGGEGHGEPVFVVESGPKVSVGDIKASDAVFCLNSKRVFSGPHSLKTLIRKVNEEEASLKDTVWKEGWSSFVPLEQIPELTKEIKGGILNPDLAKATGKKKVFSLGLSTKGMSVPTLKFWKSRLFLALVFVVIPLALYQALSKGMIPGVSMPLPPLPIDAIFDGAINAGSKLPRLMAPVVDVFQDHMPEFIQEWASPITNIENVPLEKMKELRQTARTSLEQGVAIGTAVAVGDEINPIFHVVTNMPDGVLLTMELRGKAGTLLNATSFSKTLFAEVLNHYSKTAVVYADAGKPVPRGDYMLLIYEADKQSPEAAQFIASLPAKKASSLTPPGKKIFQIETYFLGGKKDALYQQKLAEFNAKLVGRRSTEVSELQQVISAIESNIVEDSSKATTLSAVRNAGQRMALWKQHEGRMVKLAGQLRGLVDKPKEQLEKEYLLGPLYEKTTALLMAWWTYHAQVAASVEKPGSMAPDLLQEMQRKLATDVAALKQELAK